MCSTAQQPHAALGSSSDSEVSVEISDDRSCEGALWVRVGVRRRRRGERRRWEDENEEEVPAQSEERTGPNDYPAVRCSKLTIHEKRRLGYKSDSELSSDGE
jgi:hypothetical protein